MTICLCSMLISQTSLAQPSNYQDPDAGTEANPYLISNLANLKWFSEVFDDWWVNANTQVHFLQTANIDATESESWNGGMGFFPIGRISENGYEFTGIYDGDDFFISNLYMSISGNPGSQFENFGFFGYVQNSIIMNLHLLDVNYIIHNSRTVGVITGNANETTFINCSTSGNFIMTGENRPNITIGGMVGYMFESHIVDCNSSVTISGNCNGVRDTLIGGLVGNGRSNSTIVNSYTNSDITAYTTSVPNPNNNYQTLMYIGGIAGILNMLSDIDNCFTTGNYHGTTVIDSDPNGIHYRRYILIGGIVGAVNVSNIRNSFTTGSLYASGWYCRVGGIAGEQYPYASISNCYSEGNMFSEDGYGHVGGIVGRIEGSVPVLDWITKVENCYSTGDITAFGSLAGGIAGMVDSFITIINCWSSSTVTSEYAAGGLAAEVRGTGTIIKDSHFIGNVIINNHHLPIPDSFVAGGIAAILYWADIENCYVIGNINAFGRESDPTTIVGGIAGLVTINSNILNTYILGNILVEDAPQPRVGGIVGGAQVNSSVTNCYFANGTINTPGAVNPSIGGIAGFYGDDTPVINNVWDTESSGVLVSAGLIINSPTYPNYGHTIEEMKQANTYTNYGWDFVTLWNINPTLNNGFPYLDPREEVDEKDIVIKPQIAKLLGNYPNPFNPETTIKYSLSVASNLRVDIYNIKGQKIKSLVNEYKPAGEYNVVWNGTDENGISVGSGIYFYRMTTEEYTAVKRMILMK